MLHDLTRTINADGLCLNIEKYKWKNESNNTFFRYVHIDLKLVTMKA